MDLSQSFLFSGFMYILPCIYGLRKCFITCNTEVPYYWQLMHWWNCWMGIAYECNFWIKIPHVLNLVIVSILNEKWIQWPSCLNKYNFRAGCVWNFKSSCNSFSFLQFASVGPSNKFLTNKRICRSKEPLTYYGEVSCSWLWGRHLEIKLAQNLISIISSDSILTKNVQNT